MTCGRWDELKAAGRATPDPATSRDRFEPVVFAKEPAPKVDKSRARQLLLDYVGDHAVLQSTADGIDEILEAFAETVRNEPANLGRDDASMTWRDWTIHYQREIRKLARYDVRSLLEVQRVFNEKLQRVKHGRGLGDLTEQERAKVVKDLVQLTIVELVEMLGHVNWKPHRPDKPRDRARLLEEFVDAFKYTLNFFIYAPFTVEEFLDAFDEKSAVVMERLLDEYGGGR